MIKGLKELFDELQIELPQEIENEVAFKYYLREAKRLIKKGADKPDSIYAERLNGLLTLLETFKRDSVRKSLFKKDLERRVTVTLPRREYSDLKNLVRCQRVTVTYFVREAISAHIKKYTNKNCK